MEKPFGKDTESFNKLSADLYQHLSEEQMYRIDHYLGKELIENLTVRSHPPHIKHHASLLHLGSQLTVPLQVEQSGSLLMPLV